MAWQGRRAPQQHARGHGAVVPQQLHRSQQQMVVGGQALDSLVLRQHTYEGQGMAAWQDQTQLAKRHWLGGKGMDRVDKPLVAGKHMGRELPQDPCRKLMINLMGYRQGK